MSNDSQNDNSSKVLPDVSGKNRYINTTSNTSQQQYTNNHFQAIRFNPIGLTYVAKKVAPRPKNWNQEMPRDLPKYGNISIR